jgi:hypothetical protein
MVTKRTSGRTPRRQTRSPPKYGLEVTHGDSRRLEVTSRTSDDLPHEPERTRYDGAPDTA